ncbi:hypothetical protein ACFE04_020625 [Oxalis oulophora]
MVNSSSTSRLAPLSEEPINEDHHEGSTTTHYKGGGGGNGGGGRSWKNWLKTHFSFNKKSDIKLLLSVLACPLFPVSVFTHDNNTKPQPINIINEKVSSSAQYIIQHFMAATGCRKLVGRVKNIYVTGKVTMATTDELGSSSIGSASVGSSNNGLSQKGCFVMWQMEPNKWLIELVLGGHKVVAGSDGHVAWRHTPWLGAHAAKGGVRPLRRTHQGLDPVAISAIFSTAQYMGEKRITGVDCFVLKLSANQSDLANRSDSTAEMIKHVMFGYFSQRSGLLVYLEDSYLTRIQCLGSFPTYWETTMSTKIGDYRMVEGTMIAHTGHTRVIITQFGDNLKSNHVSVTRMEENWTIDDVAFDVPGLSLDCFIPPTEVVQKDFPDEINLDWRSPPVSIER